MAGRGTISVNQTAQYGEKTAIDKLKSTMTETAMTGVPTPAPTAGRPPSGQTPTQAPPQPGGAQGGVPAEHTGKMGQFAQAFRTNQYWQGVVAQYPSEWARMYAQEAADVLSKVQADLRNSTPFFE